MIETSNNSHVMQIDPTAHLPKEVMEFVLEQLDNRSFFCCTRVSHRWQQVSMQSDLRGKVHQWLHDNTPWPSIESEAFKECHDSLAALLDGHFIEHLMRASSYAMFFGSTHASSALSAYVESIGSILRSGGSLFTEDPSMDNQKVAASQTMLASRKKMDAITAFSAGQYLLDLSGARLTGLKLNKLRHPFSDLRLIDTKSPDVLYKMPMVLPQNLAGLTLGKQAIPQSWLDAIPHTLQNVNIFRATFPRESTDLRLSFQSLPINKLQLSFCDLSNGVRLETSSKLNRLWLVHCTLPESFDVGGISSPDVVLWGVNLSAIDCSAFPNTLRFLAFRECTLNLSDLRGCPSSLTTLTIEKCAVDTFDIGIIPSSLQTLEIQETDATAMRFQTLPHSVKVLSLDQCTLTNAVLESLPASVSRLDLENVEWPKDETPILNARRAVLKLAGSFPRTLLGTSSITTLAIPSEQAIQASFDLIASSVQRLRISGPDVSAAALGSIPQNIRRLEFEDIEGATLDVSQIPPHIQILCFRKSFLEQLALETLPPHIENLRLSNCDVTGLDWNKLPNTVRELGERGMERRLTREQLEAIATLRMQRGLLITPY